MDTCVMDTWVMDTCVMDTCVMDTCVMDTCVMDTCVMDDNTWSDGDKESEVVPDIVKEGSGAVDGRTNLTLGDMQAAIGKGCGSLKSNHMSAFIAANSWRLKYELESLEPHESRKVH